MSVIDDIYKVYLTVKGEEILLPQTPDTIEIGNDDKTEVKTLVNGRPFTIPQLDGPQTFKFNFEITRKKYPYTFEQAVKGIRFFTDLVWSIKEDREPIGLTIVRTHGEPSTNVKVLLQTYPYKEEADNLSDYIFSVSFIEYHPQRNQELQTQETHHLLVAGEATGWSAEIKGAVQQAVGAANNDAQIKAEVQAQRLSERGI